jgi:ABC-type lipoprotein release transport system permease subunit
MAFSKELLDKIVGINGHIFLQAADTQFTDYDEVVKEVAAVPGVIGHPDDRARRRLPPPTWRLPSCGE